MDRNHWHLAGEAFRYEYEVTGLRALPDRPLRMVVDLRYDSMPVLHVERVTFALPHRVLAIADPCFHWIYARYAYSPTGDVTPTARSDDPTLWAAIEWADGDSLRALFNGYEAPGYRGLADFDHLPETESTPLTLRLITSRRTSALFPFDR